MFETLAALVEARGRLVTKDDLLQQVWPDAFVEEGSLTRNISTIRKILGNESETATCIETIPKRGYRFLLPVQLLSQPANAGSEHPSVTPSPQQSEPAVQPGAEHSSEGMPHEPLAFAPGATAIERSAEERLRRWSFVIVAGSVVLLVVFASVAGLLPHRESSEDVTRLDLATPTTRDPLSFAVSSDGRQMLFVANWEGQDRLWLRNLRETAARPLPGTEGARYPFWSPDGRAIAFFADRRLKRLDLPDGVPLDLAEASDPLGGAWSPNGVILFAPARTGGTGIKRIAASGGEVSSVVRPEGSPCTLGWPQFLADGRHFIYFVATSDPVVRGVYMASLDDTGTSRVASSDAAALYVAPDWLLLTPRQGVLVATRFDLVRARVMGDPVPVATNVAFDFAGYRAAVAGSSTGVLTYRAAVQERRQFVWRDRAGRVLGTFAPLMSSFVGAAALSPDGSRMAAPGGEPPDVETWLLDAGGKASMRVTFNGGGAFPIWSPDGRHLAYTKFRQSSTFVKSIGADDEHLLLQEGLPEDWSPDGRSILFSRGSHLWVRPLERREQFQITRSRGIEMLGQFSPNGRWIAYQSNQSGRFEVYLQAFPSPTGQLPVSTAGGTQPRWRYDGKELFYVAPDGQLMAVPIALDSGASTEVGTPMALFPAKVASGAAVFVPEQFMRHQYSVSRSGRFLLNSPVEDPAPGAISVELNWEAALRPARR